MLNRVIGSGGVIPQSIIDGILSSNGRVFLLNPSGVVIGAGATIDVAGLVTSSLNLSNEDFLAGRLRFTEVPSAGAVKNAGTIETPSGGRVFLIAPNVENSGVIRTPDGQIVLAAGKSVELAAENTPFVTVKITADNEQALNVGSLVAKDGSINMHGALVRQSGKIEAGGAVVGANGEIRLVATKDLTLTAGSKTTANGATGGKVLLQAENGTNLVQGTVEANGDSGKGGTVHALGVRVGVIGNGVIDASGETGGGTVLVGGDYQGGNANVQNAQRALVGSDGVIRADAKNTGDGGRVIVWADQDTRFAGTISARGGANGGNGGFVETSGKIGLDIDGGFVDTRAPLGSKGDWLLDPANINIISGASSYGVLDVDQFTDYGGSDLTISGSTIESAASSSNVTLSASSNITLETSLNISSANSLTMLAYGNIDLQANNITTSGGNITLTADWDNSGSGNITHAVGGGNLTSNGGNIQLSGADINIGSINSSTTTAASNGGNVNLVINSATSGGNIAVNGSINTKGANGSSTSNYGKGGNGGSVNAYGSNQFWAGNVTVFGSIDADGGNGVVAGGSGPPVGYYGGGGGNGGSVNIYRYYVGSPSMGGNINVNGNITTRSGTPADPTNPSGATGLSQSGGGLGGAVDLRGQTITLGSSGNGSVDTSGGRGSSATVLTNSGSFFNGASGGGAGSVTIHSNSLSFGSIAANGGNGGAGGPNNDGGTGGGSGSVTINVNGTAGITLGSIAASGGQGGSGVNAGNGGVGNAVSISSAGAIAVNGAITAMRGLTGSGASTFGGAVNLTSGGSGSITQAQAIKTSTLTTKTSDTGTGSITLMHAGNDFTDIGAVAYGGSISINTVNAGAKTKADNGSFAAVYGGGAVLLKTTNLGASITVSNFSTVRSAQSVTIVSDAAPTFLATGAYGVIAPTFNWQTANNQAMTVSQGFFSGPFHNVTEYNFGSDTMTAALTLSGNISVGTNKLGLLAGSISQTGSLSTGELTAKAFSGNVNLTNSGNAIGALRAGQAAGAFALTTSGAINPTAYDVKAGTSVTLTNTSTDSGNTWNLGTLNSTSGTVTVVSDNIGIASGSSNYNISGPAFIWRTANNKAMGVGQAFFNGIHTSAVTLGGSGQTADIVLTGASDLSGTGTSSLHLYTAGQAYQASGATLKVAGLSAYGSSVLFTLPGNDIQSFQGNATNGNLAIVTKNNLKLTSFSNAGFSGSGASATGTASIFSDGDITSDIVGNYAIRGGTVGMVASKSIGSKTTPIEVSTSTLSLIGGTGVYVTTNRLSPGMVTLGDLVNSGIGDILINAYGGATTTTLVDNPKGSVDIHTFSPLNVQAGINAGGNIALSTSGGGSNNLQLNGTFTYGGTSFSATPGTGGVSIQGTGYTVVALAPASTGTQLVEQLTKTDSNFKQALDVTTKETAKTTETTTSTTTTNNDSPTQDEKKDEKDKKGNKVGAAVCS